MSSTSITIDPNGDVVIVLRSPQHEDANTPKAVTPTVETTVETTTEDPSEAPEKTPGESPAETSEASTETPTKTENQEVPKLVVC